MCVQVTGAGRGLGREISLQLAKEGAKLVCVDINAEGVQETAETINSGGGDHTEADFHVTNVADIMQVNELAKTVIDKWGRVDVLINNAGIVASSPLLDSTDDQIRRMVDVNLMSHFWVSTRLERPIRNVDFFFSTIRFIGKHVSYRLLVFVKNKK